MAAVSSIPPLSSGHALIPLENLTSNLNTVITRGDVVLDTNLQVVQKKRSQTNYNPILKAILTRLEVEIPTTALSIETVINLKEASGLYIKKLNLAISVTKGGRPLDPDLVSKISETGERIFAQTIIAYDNANSLCESKPLPIYPSLEEVGAQRFVELVVTDTCIFRAAHLLSTATDSFLQYRTQVVLDGGHWIVENGVPAFCHPKKYYDLPGPLFSLLCFIALAVNMGKLSDEKTRETIIAKVVHARQRYPEHTEAINNLLIQAQMQEARDFLRLRGQDLSSAISEEAQKLCITGKAGATFKAITDLFFKFGERMEITTLTQPCPTEEDKKRAAEAICNEEANSFRELAVGCADSVRMHQKTASQWLPEYKKAYEMLLDSKKASFLQCKKKNASLEHSLPFTPVAHSGIFDEKNDIDHVVPKTIPDPKELLSLLEPPRLPSYVSVLGSLLEQRTAAPSVSSTPADKNDFLPVEALKQRKTKKQPVKRAPKYSSISHPQPKDVEEKLVSRMEVLSVSKSSSSTSIIDTPCQPLPSTDRNSIDTTPQLREPPPPALALITFKSPYSFGVNSGYNKNLHFAEHVLRWWIRPESVFAEDSSYNKIQWTAAAKAAIIFRHTIALALIPVVIECGHKFLQIDAQGRTSYTYTLASDARWTDGSTKFERGVVSVSFNPISRVCFHLFFSKKDPKLMFKEYVKNGFFPADDEKFTELVPAHENPAMTLPDDGSRIERIDEFGVTVIDPKNHVRFEPFFI